MNIISCSPLLMRAIYAFCFLFALSAVHATNPLPDRPFPLGDSNLTEVRTVREVRPGLTHIHVQRGSWGPEGLPMVTFGSGSSEDLAELSSWKECLESMGYAVLAHRIDAPKSPRPKYILTAGEFNTPDELRQAARLVPCPVGIVNPAYLNDWQTGPWIFDIIIIDPSLYKGKVVSSWSGTALRESPLEMARKQGAVVAMNAGFFEYSDDGIAGVPTGISISQGQWHHEVQSRDHNAPIVYLENYLDGHAELSISYDAPPAPEFKWGKGNRMPLDGIDRMPRENDLVAMRPLVWWTSPLSHRFDSDRISVRQIGGDSYLGYGSYIDGGLILLATGSKRSILEDPINSEMPVELDLSVAGRPGLNAWYATPVLIHNGHLNSDILGITGRAARSLIGADTAGRIYLITASGGYSADRMLGVGVGATIPEMQVVADFLGLVNAANFDGGNHSTSMAIEGKSVIPDYYPATATPYDDNRRVGDAVLVIDD